MKFSLAVTVLSICLLSLSFAAADEGQQNGDLIVNLPGAPKNLNFKQYAGYINVDASHGRNLFYWFVESQRNPAKDKLVLWLNGGPGCSSIGGMMTENGPFRVKSDGHTLLLNPNSWNTVANVLFLESPAGVGFSYSKTTSDYSTGDWRTAEDAYNFLQSWLDKYPQYRGTPFWIAGESYGGHYVPQLANRILEGNAAGQPKINIEGFMAGNPWTDMPIDNAGCVLDWWSHALISDESYQGIMNYCNFSNIGPLVKDSRKPDPATCNKYLNNANNEMGNIDIYDIYVDVCSSSGRKPLKIIEQFARAGSHFHQLMMKGQQKNARINPPYEPCADEYTQTYMNLPQVQEAIHADINYPWTDCSGLVQYNYTDVEQSVIPLYQKFVQEKSLRILVYSGDVDAIVPVTGTRQWLGSLTLPVKQPWRSWQVNGQVGGYVTVYDGLTFSTVRNAGHMVPQTQPGRALAMFSKFLYNTPF